MRILLTNDDGVNARGLKVLEAVARKLGDDIWVVAPAEEQSGAESDQDQIRRRKAEREQPVGGVECRPGQCGLDEGDPHHQGAGQCDNAGLDGQVAIADRRTTAGSATSICRLIPFCICRIWGS